MTKKPAATIRLLGANRSYADGAEEDVLSALELVTDHSDGSDELYSHAVDWPTTYHFSPRRSNLLRPFEIKKHHRVLEIGAGTGAVTRYLGETGAKVTALEGESIRAQAIAARCSDLANVEIVSGSLFDFDDPSGFDLVVIIGVLEYAGPATTDHRHQLDFLRHASGLLRPDGTLVLAIENQIGLKYLLGYSEDHLDQPWAGVEGYPGSPPICTVPKVTLGSLLDAAGLTTQRWYYPYPDYKLPRTILSEGAFDLPTSKELVDQLVGRPIQDLANPPSRFCDDRACHRVFLEAGLGPEVANSFLVAAARQDSALDGITDDTAIAWHFSSDRLKRWRRSQTVRRADGDLRLTASSTHPETTAAATTWLDHDPTKDDEFVLGQTLEQQALESSRNLDPDGLAKVIQRWHAILEEHETTAPDARDEDIPFAPRPGRAELPPEYLDASLSNFVDSGDAVVFIDREWRLDSPVDATLTRIRSLWYLALDLVVSGVSHPFGAHTSVNDLTIRLGELADLHFDQELIQSFITDEARIQEVVTGKPAERLETDLSDLGSTTRTEKEATNNLPVAQVRRDLIQLGEMLQGMESQAEGSRRYQASLEEQISSCGSRMLELEEEYRQLEHRFKIHQTANQEAATWAKNLETKNREMATWAKGLDAQNQEAAAWAKELEVQNQEAVAWAKELEVQNQEAVAWAKEIEAQNQEATTWAKEIEAQNQEATTWAKNLEAQNQKAAAWVKELEAQNQQTVTWAKSLEAQNKDATTWAKNLENHNQELTARARNLEAQNKETASWAKNLENHNQELANWAKDLEAQNKDATTWAKNLEAQNQETVKWAKSLEAQNKDATTWAKKLENHNQELATWAKDLETQIQEAQTRERDLIRTAAEAEEETVKTRADRTALELRVLGLAREVEDLRTWKGKVSSRPLVRLALALHQFISPVDTDD